MPERDVMLARARGMRRDPTPAERAMWRMLQDRRLAGLKFRRQFPVGRYIADFACLDPRVIVECDGGQHADSRYDLARDAWFVAQGFRIMRFWNDAVLSEANGVFETLLAALTPP